MADFIIYDGGYIDDTIADLKYKTKRCDIDNIVKCSGDISAEFNKAVGVSSSDLLVFVRSPVKFEPNWFDKIHDVVDDTNIVIPAIYGLNAPLWGSTGTAKREFGIRWDMSVVPKQNIHSNQSPIAPSGCMIMSRAWFDKIGRFDDHMCGIGGEDIDISLKCWLNGGEVAVCDGCCVAVGNCATKIELSNLARVAETWFQDYSSAFYESRGIKRSAIKFNKLPKHTTNRNVEWWMNNLQQELIGIYNMVGTAKGRTVAVVGDGPSIDLVNKADIMRHDVIISIDFIGLYIESDYIVTNSYDVIMELRGKYDTKKFITPCGIQYWDQYIDASELAPGCIKYDSCGWNDMALKIGQPFHNYDDNNLLIAIQFAMMLKPDSITVFGSDNRLVNGLSHTSSVEFYKGGAIWKDDEYTRSRFASYEFAMKSLGKLAQDNGIPLFRMSHL